jgi:hypothetical protein
MELTSHLQAAYSWASEFVQTACADRVDNYAVFLGTIDDGCKVTGLSAKVSNSEGLAEFTIAHDKRKVIYTEEIPLVHLDDESRLLDYAEKRISLALDACIRRIPESIRRDSRIMNDYIPKINIRVIMGTSTRSARMTPSTP